MDAATRTLPASWFTSQNLYHLEQRAVFHKAWYLIGAVPRFAVDRKVSYEFAGVAITVHHDGDEKFRVIRDSDVCFPILPS
jgi:phenylpropionate dioxygenase-like ring-hydroxylating dioxygenase large terminal subunit